MTWDTALRELGLGPEPTVEQARRAYLRLLKTRKPEVDPDGFQRLRAAYELVTSAIAWRRPPQEVGDLPADAPSSNPTPATQPPDPPRETSADAEPPCPKLAPLDEIMRLMKSGSAAAAAEGMGARYEAGSRSPNVIVPSPYLTLQVLLDLHRQDDLAPAARLHAAFVQWLQATGSETKIMSGGIVAAWVVVRELGALPPSFAPELRAAIASATRAGDLMGAMDEVEAYRSAEPLEAETMAALLRKKTTLLAASFATKLDGRAKPVSAVRSGGGAPWRYTWFVPVILSLFRMASGDCGSPSPQTQRLASDPAPYTAGLSPRHAIARRAALSLASSAGKAGQYAVQAHAGDVATSMSIGDCTGGLDAMRALHAAAKGGSSIWSDVLNDLHALDSSFARVCGALNLEKEPSLDSSPGDTK